MARPLSLGIPLHRHPLRHRSLDSSFFEALLVVMNSVVGDAWGELPSTLKFMHYLAKYGAARS